MRKPASQISGCRNGQSRLNNRQVCLRGGYAFSLTFLLTLAFQPGCVTAPVQQDPIPAYETFEIESNEVNETRVINAWKPPGYEESDTSFPVVYMPDGGINEDFPHIANTLAKLVADKSIPPCLLIGIENTQRRRDLTGPSKVEADAKIAPLGNGSSKFRRFISDELIPEIDRRYRTTQTTAILGESAAGLFVVETLLLEPALFDAYIAMDPAIYWNDSWLVRKAPEQLRSIPDRPIRFWFATSGEPDIAPDVFALVKQLESAAPANLTWEFVDADQEQHHTIFRATKESAFRWALGSGWGADPSQ
jgi:predicted alpha/beta superfamily hydrolase